MRLFLAFWRTHGHRMVRGSPDARECKQAILFNVQLIWGNFEQNRRHASTTEQKANKFLSRGRRSSGWLVKPLIWVTMPSLSSSWSLLPCCRPGGGGLICLFQVNSNTITNLKLQHTHSILMIRLLLNRLACSCVRLGRWQAPLFEKDATSTWLPSTHSKAFKGSLNPNESSLTVSLQGLS